VLSVKLKLLARVESYKTTTENTTVSSPHARKMICESVRGLLFADGRETDLIRIHLRRMNVTQSPSQ
jgi:hypothetical protein